MPLILLILGFVFLTAALTIKIIIQHEEINRYKYLFSKAENTAKDKAQELRVLQDKCTKLLASYESQPKNQKF